MTLCIVWRDESKIKFASDSRLSFGSAGTSDFGIKVVRIPFKIYGPGEIAGAEPISSGDLGMAFAGSAIGALMVKEALAEVLFRMQGVPNFHDCGMDGIADFVFRAYKVISKDLCTTMLENGRTCIVFGGCCAIQKKLRAPAPPRTLAKRLTPAIAGRLIRRVPVKGATNSCGPVPHRRGARARDPPAVFRCAARDVPETTAAEAQESAATGA